MGLFNAIGKFATSNPVGTIAGVELEKKARRQMQGLMDEQKRGKQIEAEFAGRLNDALISGDPDAAEQVFRTFRGHLRPETASDAAQKIIGLKEKAVERQKANQQQQVSAFQQQASTTKATPDEASALLSAQQADDPNTTGGSFLSVLGRINKNIADRDSAAKEKKAFDIAKMLPGEDRGGFLKENVQGIKMPQNASPRLNAAAQKRRGEVISLLSRGDLTPEQAINEIKSANGGQLPTDVEGSLKNDFASFGLRVNMGEEQRKRLGLSMGLQTMANKIIGKLDDPTVREAVGKYQGAATNVMRWLTGEATAPPEVIDFLFKIGMGVDDLSRMKSGAALTEQEVQLFKDLLGSELKDPAAIQQRMTSLVESMNDQIEATYKAALLQKYGGNIPDDVLAQIPRTEPVRAAGINPAQGNNAQSPNNLGVQWNPQTNQWEPITGQPQGQR